MPNYALGWWVASFWNVGMRKEVKHQMTVKVAADAGIVMATIFSSSNLAYLYVAVIALSRYDEQTATTATLHRPISKFL